MAYKSELCCLDGLEFAVGIIEWYLFPFPVWMYKP
jgi:hypothetical protein